MADGPNAVSLFQFVGLQIFNSSKFKIQSRFYLCWEYRYMYRSREIFGDGFHTSFVICKYAPTSVQFRKHGYPVATEQLCYISGCVQQDW